jgi:very-short-patch-repair endonuclease
LICQFCNKETKSLHGLNIHVARLHKGISYKGHNQFTKAEKLGLPKPKGVATNGFLGKKHSDKTKRKLSAAQKLAHEEGRAWNIGKSRWNNTPSYPEKFFIKVIENEFDDKNYVREFRFGKFSLDFAWPEKKVAIEIDGKQHFTDQAQMERDKRKNALTLERGWSLLRIKWLDLFQNTKYYIDIAKRWISDPSGEGPRLLILYSTPWVRVPPDPPIF